MRRSVGVLCLIAACAVPAKQEPPDDTDVRDTDVPDTDVADTDLPAAPGCVLGTGVEVLSPLVAGADVVVTRGSQGRWHVFGALTCSGIVSGGTSGSSSMVDLSNPDNPVVDWTVTDLGGSKLAGYNGLHRPMTAPTGAGLWGEYLVFWEGTYEDSVNRDAIMVLHLVDIAGVTIDASIPIHLVPEPGWVPPTDTDVPTP